MNTQRWNFEEDNWTENYPWFLIDEGEIQYSLMTEQDARLYREQHFLDYMLLTDLPNIVNDTMLVPSEYRNWNRKIQVTVRAIERELVKE